MAPRRLAASFRAERARTRRVRGVGLAEKKHRHWSTSPPRPGRDGLFFFARAHEFVPAAEQRVTATHERMGPGRHISYGDYPPPGRSRARTPQAPRLLTLRVRARAQVLAGPQHLLLVIGGSSWSRTGGRVSARSRGWRACGRCRGSRGADRARAPAAWPPTRPRRRAARAPARAGPLRIDKE